MVEAPSAAQVGNSNRLAGTLEIEVLDGVYASATFGDDVDTPDGKRGLFMLGCVSFQLTETQRVKLPSVP